jgi:hypothetical protein
LGNDEALRRDYKAIHIAAPRSTANNRHSPGLSSNTCAPRSAKRIPDDVVVDHHLRLSAKSRHAGVYRIIRLVVPRRPATSSACADSRFNLSVLYFFPFSHHSYGS